MRIRIHPHALIHDLGEDQILAAYETGSSAAVVRTRDRHSEPPRWAVIGFDIEGRPIQLLFTRLAGDDILIFHAQYLTKQFLTEVKRAHD